MSTEQDLRDRIVSVKKTQKMTGAMKMVAAAKFKQLTKKIQLFSDYASLTRQLIDVHEDVNESPWFQTNTSPVRWVIVLAGDRGLCGGFNAGVFKQAMRTIQMTDDHIYVSGQKASTFFKAKRHVVTPLDWTADHASLATIRDTVTGFMADYASGKASELVVVRQRFVSAIQTIVTVDNLLPLVRHDQRLDQTSNQKSGYYYDCIPSVSDVLQDSIHAYLSATLYQWILETKAGEEAARMQAMTSATTNAGDMIADLELAYNRARQATITTELTEIVAGAEALTGDT